MNVAEFIKANAEGMTVQDMIEETKLPGYRIVRYFKELGLIPITRGQQTDNYIREMSSRFTAGKIALRLHVTENYVIVRCRELGIICRKEENIVESPTPGLILGAFHLDRPGVHPYDPDPYSGFFKDLRAKYDNDSLPE